VRNMTRRVLVPLVLAVAASGVAHAVTAEELIAKNLEARGGAAKLAAIKSMHSVGTVRLGGGQEAKVEAWAVQDQKYRGDFSLQGMTAIQSWDGKQAWRVSPFQGRRDPQMVSADDAKGLVLAADIAGPLSEYKAKGSTVEYLGTEDVDGTEAHKIRVRQKNGDSQIVFLDPDHFLEIRVTTKQMIRGQEETQSTDLGEYEKVDGIYFPFEIGRTHLDKVELNTEIDPTLFPVPAGGAK
jgi:outer membrane lipoprotein-sorting protein